MTWLRTCALALTAEHLQLRACARRFPGFSGPTAHQHPSEKPVFRDLGDFSGRCRSCQSCDTVDAKTRIRLLFAHIALLSIEVDTFVMYLVL